MARPPAGSPPCGALSDSALRTQHAPAQRVLATHACGFAASLHVSSKATELARCGFSANITCECVLFTPPAGVPIIEAVSAAQA